MTNGWSLENGIIVAKCVQAKVNIISAVLSYRQWNYVIHKFWMCPQHQHLPWRNEIKQEAHPLLSHVMTRIILLCWLDATDFFYLRCFEMRKLCTIIFGRHYSDLCWKSIISRLFNCYNYALVLECSVRVEWGRILQKQPT